MGELFRPGDRVRAARADPAYHTRLPRYARGAVGTVVEQQGCYPLPDRRARQLPAEPEPVYTKLTASIGSTKARAHGRRKAYLSRTSSRVAPPGASLSTKAQVKS